MAIWCHRFNLNDITAYVMIQLEWCYSLYHGSCGTWKLEILQVGKFQGGINFQLMNVNGHHIYSCRLSTSWQLIKKLISCSIRQSFPSAESARQTRNHCQSHSDWLSLTSTGPLNINFIENQISYLISTSFLPLDFLMAVLATLRCRFCTQTACNKVDTIFSSILEIKFWRNSVDHWVCLPRKALVIPW